ncbi:MAG: ferrous iron transport protein A [bacterium]
MDLTQMREGERGKVIDIQGGGGLLRKLEALGIKLGTEIVKVSSQLMRGPIIIRIGNTQVAIGFGMARRIIVERKK